MYRPIFTFDNWLREMRHLSDLSEFVVRYTSVFKNLSLFISYYDFGVYEESFCAVGTQGAFQLRHAKKYKLWEHTL